jgi:hypothetical protein
LGSGVGALAGLDSIVTFFYSFSTFFSTLALLLLTFYCGVALVADFGSLTASFTVSLASLAASLAAAAADCFVLSWEVSKKLRIKAFCLD